MFRVRLGGVVLTTVSDGWLQSIAAMAHHRGSGVDDSSTAVLSGRNLADLLVFVTSAAQCVACLPVTVWTEPYGLCAGCIAAQNALCFLVISSLDPAHPDPDSAMTGEDEPRPESA